MENKKDLAVYALQDKEIGIFDSFLNSFDDAEAVKFYMENLRNLYFTLDDDQKKQFEERLVNTCIYKLAVFDNRTGEFTNNKLLLIDYLSIDILKDYFKKDEVKKNE